MGKLLARIALIVGLLVPLVGGVWYFADQAALAQSTEKRVSETEKKQETLKDAVKTLKDIHVRQETVAEAERRLKARLCAEGKLTGADCR